MDGLVMKSSIAVRQQSRCKKLGFASLHRQSALHAIRAAGTKKGARVALTRLAPLRHNNLVRECVHDEKFSRSR
jgi:hypothetical protein